MPAADRLIFVHGLWMSGAESRWLRRRLEAAFGFFMRTRKVRALIKLHGDVRAEEVCLDLDGAGGGEAVGGAVDMALEGDAICIHLAQLGERPDLEAAAVCQHRAAPA